MRPLADILVELNQMKGSWPSIAEKAGVPYNWVLKVAKGRIKAPSYERIRRLEQAMLM